MFGVEILHEKLHQKSAGEGEELWKLLEAAVSHLRPQVAVWSRVVFSLV